MTVLPGGISPVLTAGRAWSSDSIITGTSRTAAGPKFATVTSMNSGTPAARVPRPGRRSLIARLACSVSTQLIRWISTPEALSRARRPRSSPGSFHCRVRKSVNR